VHLLDLLLPQRCLGCGRGGTQLCAACRLQLPSVEPPLCARCGAPTAWRVERCLECAGRRLAFASARGAVAYEGAVRRLVAAWKERGLHRLAAVAAAVMAERLEPPRADVVAFVPPDRARRRERGHHPAERLARELADAWCLPCCSLLERQGPARRQRGLPLAERRRNLRGAFASQTVAGIVLLVDDVYTSGATVDAGAAALRAAGARAVHAVTFARTIRSPSLGLERGR
jgi:predicted amidophosphoribosyltransferase